MKQSSKIALGVAAGAAALVLLKKKKDGSVSGIGKTGTTVVFRKFDDGEVIALFPNEKWDIDGREIASYMHYGQHGGASPELIRKLKKATLKEYKDLYDELVMIGYDDLVIDKGIGATKEKAKKYYVYAGYYENYVSSEPMPAPYILRRTFRSIDRALDYAESFGDYVVYCDNVKYDLPDFLYENLQDSDYEFFRY